MATAIMSGTGAANPLAAGPVALTEVARASGVPEGQAGRWARSGQLDGLRITTVANGLRVVHEGDVAACGERLKVLWAAVRTLRRRRDGVRVGA